MINFDIHLEQTNKKTASLCYQNAFQQTINLLWQYTFYVLIEFNEYKLYYQLKLNNHFFYRMQILFNLFQHTQLNIIKLKKTQLATCGVDKKIKLTPPQKEHFIFFM